jgi:hypothetical protein
LGFKVSKKVLWPKNFFSTNLKMGIKNNAELYADFKTVEKNAKDLLFHVHLDPVGSASFWRTDTQPFQPNVKPVLWIQHFLSMHIRTLHFTYP